MCSEHSNHDQEIRHYRSLDDPFDLTKLCQSEVSGDSTSVAAAQATQFFNEQTTT